jgi:hypothetical protein
MIFLLMSGLNIRCIEQLKHIRQGEAGRVLGLGSVPSIWGWFHEAAQKASCELLLSELFDDQIDRGLVGARL